MKKHLFFSVLTLLFAVNIFALEVDEDEIKSSANDTIEFINYTGPHKVIDSIAAIRGIGSDLGKVVGESVSDASTSGNQNKYYVVHAVDSTTDKLDADIVFIGKNATVDHIDNLRRIISSYLSAAYGYSQHDADTLAVFVTVYNAVYRGNNSYFASKYKDIVMSNLSSNSGLSVNYKDWPGNSEIVIPLYDVTDGGLSTVDTSVISDSKVIDSMQDDEDKNIDTRKDMVDLKERESEQASEKAKDAQKEAVAEQKKLDEQKKTTETAKKEAETAQKEADEKKKVAEENPDDKKAQQEAEEAEKAAEEKKQVLEEEEKKLEEQKQVTEEAKETAEEQQQLADKKQAEAKAERKEIAKDQQEVQKREADALNALSAYGLIVDNDVSDNPDMFSKFVRFNVETGEKISESVVKPIRSRTIYKTTDSYIAIAGDNSSENEMISLVLIDPDTMGLKLQGSENVAPDSVLVQDDFDYYCVIEVTEKSGNKDVKRYYVAKYDEDLNLKLKSDVPVVSYTPITVAEDYLVVTGANNKLKILDKKNLSAKFEEIDSNANAK